MLKQGERWVTKAAGPTTSIREEPYQADVIKRYGVRAVVGKGGMGAKTLAAMKDSGAVYLNGIGGPAQYYARAVEEVKEVHRMEFGIPEGEITHGNSLHAEVEKETGAALKHSCRRPSRGFLHRLL